MAQNHVPRELLQEIQARTSIVDVVGRYVSLQKRGRSFVGLCPFHREKSPSFHVDESKGLFYCFGCQAGGDVFKFLTLIENEGFMEVVRDLAQRVGIHLPEREISPDERQRLSERDQLFQLYEIAASFYERQLMEPSAGNARDYFQRRGLTPELIRAFRLGFAPAGWSALADYLRRLDQPLRLAERGGLVVPRQGSGYYDRFRERVLFPIRNVSGKVVAFGGRILDQGEPKYLNSPEHPLFNKSQALYGLDMARRAIGQEDGVVVVEGYFDALALSAAGVQNVVATCGTSLTQGHLQILKRYTRRIFLLYDGDDAGQNAAARSLPLFLEEDLWPYYIALPRGLDPDDLVRQEGPEGLRARVQAAVPLLEQVIMKHARAGTEGAQAREDALQALAPLFARLSPEKIDLYISFVARHFGMYDEAVRTGLERQRPTTGAARNPGLEPPRSRPPIPLPTEEAFLVQWIFHRPDEILPAAREALICEWMAHDGLKRIVLGALEAFQTGAPVAAGALTENVNDPALRNRLMELALQPFELAPGTESRAMMQTLLGIKEKTLQVVLQRLQGEVERLQRHPTEDAVVSSLVQRKLQLSRELSELKRRRRSAG